MSKVYLVGGAVRDSILGREVHDRDWVIVGSTVEEMDSCGYEKVGEHFPVYLLHNGEELAMARTEISTGSGYNDFEVAFGPDVTIIEDLYRRDFTINAIAYDDETKSYIDPYGGIKDLINKKIRMVNVNAFRDDPLRVFRGIRFACRYEFEIEDDTMKEIETMVKSGALSNLPRERMFKELCKIHDDGTFNQFYNFIRDCDMLEAFGFTEYYGGNSTYNATLPYFLCTVCETRDDFKNLDKVYKIPNEFKMFADVWFFEGSEFELIKKCRGDQDTPMLKVALELGMVDAEQVKAYRSVTSETFPEVTGKDLGRLIMFERERRIDQLYKDRVAYQDLKYGWVSWETAVREVKFNG
ncbi:putative tRNA nucleotidyltransferase [Aeromonas phage Aswh_1]|nr:putative tRNA nucleotidyltransferase [Aeromonas phage Aswh_1]